MEANSLSFPFHYSFSHEKIPQLSSVIDEHGKRALRRSSCSGEEEEGERDYVFAALRWILHLYCMLLQRALC